MHLADQKSLDNKFILFTVGYGSWQHLGQWLWQLAEP
jgi:hypothetical protein